MQHVLLRENCRSLQIAVSGASVLRPLRLYVDAILQPQHLKFHVAALQFLNDINDCRRVSAACFRRNTAERVCVLYCRLWMARWREHLIRRSPLPCSGDAVSKKIGVIQAAIFAIRYVAPSNAAAT